MSKEATAYHVETFSDWLSFLEVSESLLLEREAESNLIWEVGRVSAESAGANRPWLGWVVMEGERAFLAALPSVTGYLILSGGEPLPFSRSARRGTDSRR